MNQDNPDDRAMFWLKVLAIVIFGLIGLRFVGERIAANHNPTTIPPLVQNAVPPVKMPDNSVGWIKAGGEQ
jgi:hypothetical protein